MTDRTTRASETRETQTRRKPWAPPSRLESPEPPVGFVHRWIRIAMRGEEDKMNVHSKLREGWEPVRADEYPKFQAPTIDEGRYAGIIGNGGLMLCRIPVETRPRKSRVLRDPHPRTNGCSRSGLNEGSTSFHADI
jgi:hypothetical protein